MFDLTSGFLPCERLCLSPSGKLRQNYVPDVKFSRTETCNYHVFGPELWLLPYGTEIENANYNRRTCFTDAYSLCFMLLVIPETHSITRCSLHKSDSESIMSDWCKDDRVLTQSWDCASWLLTFAISTLFCLKPSRLAHGRNRLYRGLIKCGPCGKMMNQSL